MYECVLEFCRTPNFPVAIEEKYSLFSLKDFPVIHLIMRDALGEMITGVVSGVIMRIVPVVNQPVTVPSPTYRQVIQKNRTEKTLYLQIFFEKFTKIVS